MLESILYMACFLFSVENGVCGCLRTRISTPIYAGLNKAYSTLYKSVVAKEPHHIPFAQQPFNMTVLEHCISTGHAAVPRPRSTVRGRHGFHGGGNRSASRERREDGEPAPGDHRLRRVQGKEGQRAPLPDVPRIGAGPGGVPDRNGRCSPRFAGGPGEHRIAAVFCGL